MRYSTLQKDKNYKLLIAFDATLQHFVSNYQQGQDQKDSNLLDTLIKECQLIAECMKNISSIKAIAGVDPTVKEKLMLIVANTKMLCNSLSTDQLDLKKQSQWEKICGLHKLTQTLLLFFDESKKIKHSRDVTVKIKDGIIDKIFFEENRVSFSNKTLTLFRSQKGNEDICHWKGNEVIKQEIKRMFEGQPFNSVAEHLIEAGYAVRIKNTIQLEDALRNFWKAKFNDHSNLRLGNAKANSALGSLVGVLKKKIEMSEEYFEPFWLKMEAFGMRNPADREHPHHVYIDSWEMLRDYYFNANFDFDFNQRTITRQLNDAASEFKFVYPGKR
ncbi:MAG: hypothetical protein EPO11_08685 [Gammaproteobacteria bacterium]|nr:MAG: hypothetical protein EPO11_08685 [Gammaproteobacteria bacterium]